MFYVYILLDPTLVSQTYYVGVSKNPEERLKNHLQETYNPFKKRWIGKLKSRGIIPIYIIYEEFELEDDAYNREPEVIEFFRSHNVKLCNISPGGRSGVWPVLKGEKASNVRYTKEEINNVRNDFLYNNISKIDLLKKYPQFTRDYLLHILKYHTWEEELSIEKQQLLDKRLKEDKEFLRKKCVTDRYPSFNHAAIEKDLKDFNIQIDDIKLINKGEDCTNSKLKNNDILKIKFLHNTKKYSSNNIAQFFNVKKTAITSILNNKTWKHIGDDGKINSKFNNHNIIPKKITMQQAEEIRQRFFNDKIISCKLEKEYKVSKSTIIRITHYKSYIDENTIIPHNLNEMIAERKRHGSLVNKTHKIYDEHSNSKFKIDDILEIRRLYATDKITQKELAKKYNVHEQTIYHIVSRKTWKNI